MRLPAPFHLNAKRIKAFGVIGVIFIATFSTVFSQFPAIPKQDSTKTSEENTDSLKKAAKNIRIRTVWVNPQALIDGKPIRKLVEFKLADIIEPDLLARQPGFSNTLGQIGKPYRRTVMGVESAFYRPDGLYFNPYTGAEDVYTLDAAQGLTFFDTRTPFVNLYYGQGKADLSQLRVDISQNISPFVNVGVLYYRRNSSGVYKEFPTSHNNLGVAANVRTPLDRYHGFLSAYFQEANDNMNGGVRQGFVFEELFAKSRQPVALEDAVFQRLVRSAHYRHSYTLIQDRVYKFDSTSSGDSLELNESSRPHLLRIYNSFMVDGFDHEFNDRDLDSLVNQYQFPVYPTLGDSSFFYERFKQTRYRVDGGAVYRFKSKHFQTGHRFEVAAEQIHFEKNHLEQDLRKFVNTWKGDLVLRAGPFDVFGDAKVQNTISNLFPVEPYAELGGSIGFPKEVEDYIYQEPGEILKEKDSVRVEVLHRPLRAEFRGIIHGKNPSVQQAFGNGWPGNTFEADPNLRNTRFQHARIGISYQGKSERVRDAEVPGMSLGVFGFMSRLNGMTYFDPEMQLKQAASNENLQFVGLDVRFRIKWRQFFFENQGTYQVASSNAGLDTLAGAMQPEWYGKASLYFDTRTTRLATAIRIGVDYHYSAAFRAPLFDPANQVFYPQQEFTQDMYHRFDFILATTIKRAHVFLKVIHANDGLFAPGYFSTTLYPMLDRTIMLGFNWTFFD